VNALAPQLQAIVDAFNAAQHRLHTLVGSVSPDRLSQRPAPDRWSAAECVAHLNLTSAAYVPLLDEAIDRGRRMPPREQGTPRRDLAGWLLWKSMAPPVRFRVKTTLSFVPIQQGSLPDLMAEFDRLQREQIARVRAAEALPLGQIKIASPFNARVKYNLYACLTILPRHQHRHLWQAEEAVRNVRP
jgi:hypothetical protein